jgi:histidinol-phosphatase (PHP family)
VKKGIEVDYQHCFEKNIREWLRDKEFDYVIGSVHYLDHGYITEKLISEKPLREIYSLYFTETNNSIDSALFDVIGHLDLPQRYVYRWKDKLKRMDYWENMRITLNKIIETGTYLEINSKGLRESCCETYPSSEVVNAYYEMGGRLISLGSDAHCIEEVGAGLKEIMKCLSGRRFSLL